MTILIKLLEDNSALIKEEYVETILPTPEPLLEQFARRTVFGFSDIINERLTVAYWLSPPNDEGDVDLENVRIDINYKNLFIRVYFMEGWNNLKYFGNNDYLNYFIGQQ